MKLQKKGIFSHKNLHIRNKIHNFAVKFYINNI